MPLILLFAIAMIWKECREHLSGAANFAAARNAEFLSATQLVLLAALYGLAISRVLKRDVSGHMRYTICIGVLFGVSQSLSQTMCLVAIDLCLIALIAFDKSRHLKARLYIVALLAFWSSKPAGSSLGGQSGSPPGCGIGAVCGGAGNSAFASCSEPRPAFH